MGNDPSSFSTCELGPYYETSGSSPWTLHNGKCADGSRVSVFVYEMEDIEKEKVSNLIKHLKTLKHPSIVKYLGVKESRDEIWVITEIVMPLESVLESLTPDEICAGIYSLLQVFSFLHEVGLCHNNICLNSIFVGLDGSWKLNGFEWMCKFSDATPSHLAHAAKWRSPQAIAPEEKDKRFSPQDDHGCTRDVYAFGHLAEQLLEYLSSMGELTKTFELRVSDECLSSEPPSRLQLSTLLDDRLFKCDYVDIVQFLRTLTLQNEESKEKFFSGLVKRLYSLPVSLVASRLCRPLLGRFVLLEKAAGQHLLPHLLMPYKGEETTRKFKEGELNPVLPEPVFQKYLIPELFKIFHVRDAHIRITLLQHFQFYVHQFEKTMLRSTILPQILLGVRDTNDGLVSLSLRALAELVDILGGDIVIGAHRARVFAQGTPKAGSLPGRQLAKILTMVYRYDEEACTEKADSGVVVNGSAFQKSKKSPAKNDTINEEREKKRQEARKRMEERRRKREELKQKQKVTPTNIESDDGGPADLKKDRYEEMNDLEENVKVSVSEEICQEYKHTAEEQHMDITESDIDQEIEAEINAMESTLSQDKISRVQCDVEVDWSDVSQISPSVKTDYSSDKKAVYTKGSMKLSKKTRTSPPPKSKCDNGDKNYSYSSSQEILDSTIRNREGGESGDDWGSGWNNTEPTNGEWEGEWNNSQDNSSNASTLTLKKPSDKCKSKGVVETKKLGAEFDIMALDIKSIPVAINEVDYFADMIPEIKPKADTLMTALSISDPTGERKKETPKDKSRIMSFAVKESAQTEEDGWDIGWEES